MTTIRVGIIGGTGYTGVELLRILVDHPNCQVSVVASRSEAGRRVEDLFPSLRGLLDLEFCLPEAESFNDCDVVFSATPNGVAMSHAPQLMDANVKLIDLAADFRLLDAQLWERWYGQAHHCPELLAEAVYGLPELNRSDIQTARLIANPGCYPTATMLGSLPLMNSDLLQEFSLVVDAKSGVTGAGRGANVANLYSEVSDSFKAYGVSAHRHHPEITQVLSGVADRPVKLTFVPHLVPMLRGIHATIYADLKPGVSLQDVQAAYLASYEDEPFVDVLPNGSLPDTRSVKGTNMCRISLHQATGSGKLVVLSVIDNLAKGAAGQAVQNMNIMFALDETSGLRTAALLP